MVTSNRLDRKIIASENDRVKISEPCVNGDGKQDENTSKDNRCRIPITSKEHDVNDAAVTALQDDPDLYQRGGILVHVIHTDREDEDKEYIKRPAGTPQIRALPQSLLRERLTKCASFVKPDRRRKDKNELVETHPPAWCVAAVQERGQWEGIRHLRGITTVPVLRPDGTILAVPGYDPATGLLFDPLGEVAEIPERIARCGIPGAVASLLDLVRDFPFEKPVHKSVWLAFHLTLLCRYAFDGPTPLFLFNGNLPGVGKGLLVNISSEIVYGRPAATRGYSPYDEEMRKVLTTVALKGDPLLLLDNVNDPLGGSAIERAVTTTRWADRLLGASTDVDLPWRTILAATGNNVSLVSEMPRRVLLASLNTQIEKPESRHDFKYPNLLAYVKANRLRYLKASLLILRAWWSAGKPRYDMKPWGSFEEWSEIVRNVVVWAGEIAKVNLPDPVQSRQGLEETVCSEKEDIAVVFQGILQCDKESRGILVSELVEWAQHEQSLRPSGWPLWDVLKRNWPGRTAADPVNIGSLGKVLGHRKNQIIDGMRLERVEDSHKGKGTRWRVRRIS